MEMLSKCKMFSGSGQTRTGAVSLVATGGGLIFGGDANGHFRVRAFDQKPVIGRGKPIGARICRVV
jgi:hypothetical protein